MDKQELIEAINRVLEEIEPRPTDTNWRPVDGGVALHLLKRELERDDEL